MAGGTFSAQNKTLPGVYTNYAASIELTDSGLNGIVSLALTLPWFLSHKMMTVTKDNYSDLAGYFGSASLAISEALKNAGTVLLYKLNNGEKSSAVIGNLICTALYDGTFGNNLSVTITSVVGETDKFYVSTYVGTKECDKQKVSDASELVNNGWIVFTHGETATLAANAGTSLVGGSDGTVTNSDYILYLQTVELYDFNSIACTSDSDDVKQLFVDFTKRMINDEGRYIQAVIANVSSDFEAIISIQNGVVLADGTAVSKNIVCAYVAGATSAVSLNKSLTNSQYIGAVDVDTRYTTAQQTDFAKSGQMILVPSLDNKVYIQKDINTLVTLSNERTYAFTKNKIIRTIYTIASEIGRIGRENFIGKVTNDADGRNLFKSAILSYLKQLQSQNVLVNVMPDDIVVSSGSSADSVAISYAVRPIDTVDIIYNKIVVTE